MYEKKSKHIGKPKCRKGQAKREREKQEHDMG
jgi:hypothetical protein